jgi:Flp pilus assembly protein protease CpaA
MLEFLVMIGLVAIIFAIVQDFRYREVANWLNFSLLVFALAFRAFFSSLTGDYMFLVFGIVGLSVTFVVGHLLYYGRLFAGGDAKLFIALGVILPFSNNFYDNNMIFLVFLIALLFGGAVYSLGFSGVLAYKNKEGFSKKFKELYKENVGHFYASLAFSSAFIVYSFISNSMIFMVVPIFLIGLFFLYIYAKSVEQSCMLKLVSANNVRIGDWLEKELRVKGKTIKPHWEGLSEDEVNLIKKNYKDKILIKEGIPFTPAFLIAFLVVLYIQFQLGGNWGLWGIF